MLFPFNFLVTGWLIVRNLAWQIEYRLYDVGTRQNCEAWRKGYLEGRDGRDEGLLELAPNRSWDLLDAMMSHPILINRPFVITELGVRLCRPSEVVLDILENPDIGPFTKEDGEQVIDETGQRIAG